MKIASTSMLLCVVAVSALSASQPTRADWCNGQQYLLSRMPMSQRIIDAGEALETTMQQLAASVNQLQFDLQSAVQHNQQLLNRQDTSLSIETQALCENAESGQYPLQYQNIELYSALELRARLKLNLQLLQAHQAAVEQTQEQQQGIDLLTTALQQKRATLAVLLRQLQGQQDQSALASFADQFLQSTCLAVSESASLLNEAGQFNVDSLLIDKVLQQHNNALSDDALEHYLRYCRLQPGSAQQISRLVELPVVADEDDGRDKAGLLRSLLIKTKAWFSL